MPTKLVKFHKHKHKNSKWITNGIIKSICFRDKLYLKLLKIPLDSSNYEQLKIDLKTYNKILDKTIRAAKINYYHNRFKKLQNDIKNTWVTIKIIINRKTPIKNISEQIKINGNTITDKLKIANEFNKFFC